MDKLIAEGEISCYLCEIKDSNGSRCPDLPILEVGDTSIWDILLKFQTDNKKVRITIEEIEDAND